MVRCDGEFTEDNDYICGFGHGENVCSSHHCDFCETGVCSPDCDDEYCARTKKPSSDEMNECMLCAYPMQEGEEWNQDENDWFKDGKKIQWNAWNEFSYPEDYDAETFEAYKPKKVKRVQKIDPSRMSGTSLQGYIKTNRTELRKTFGNPNMGPSGDGKVKSSGWVVSIDGKVCTIYDKREQGKKGTKFFNIGGRDMFSPLLVAQELSKTRGEKVHAIETSSEWDDEKSFKENMKRNRDFPDSHPIITPARAMEYSRNVARYGAEGFGVIAGRGFQMEFPNGYRVSVVFAPGNYGDHYDNTGDMMEHSLNPPQEWESRTAELAVFKPEGGLLDFGDEGDQVRGWINPAFVSEMFGLAAKGDEEGMKELAMKSHLYGAEGLEFTDWANQETKHHGKTSLKEWADHEIKTHGGKMSFQDWAKHEDKSHIRRFGAESKTDLMDLKVGQEIKINGLMREGEIPSQTKLRHHREWDSDGEYFPEYREGYVDVPIADDGSISTDSHNALYYAVKYWYGTGEDITDGYFFQFKARPMDEADGLWGGKPAYYPNKVRYGQLRWDKDQDRFFIDGLSEKLSDDGGYIHEDGDTLEARAYNERGIYSITPLEKKSAEEYDHVKAMREFVAWLKDNNLEPSDVKGFTPDGHVILKPITQRANYKPDVMFSAEELKKDSCCCDATKSNPCACMIKGVMDCNATCPCSLEKKVAEGLVYDRPILDSDGKPVTEWECYENNKERIDRMPSKWTCSYCVTNNIEADVVPTAERMYGNPVSSNFLEYLCTNCGRNTWMPYHFHAIEYGEGVSWCASCDAVYPDEDDTPSICDCGGEVIRGAENWGGDPTGKLALMLQKVRDKAKKPKNL